MKGWGVEPDIVTINARIHRAIEEGRLDEALDTLEQALSGVSLPLEPSFHRLSLLLTVKSL